MSLKKVHDIIKVFSKFNVYQRQLSFGQVGNLWPIYCNIDLLNIYIYCNIHLLNNRVDHPEPPLSIVTSLLTETYERLLSRFSTGKSKIFPWG